jgi:molecular chaperone DnaK
MYLGIDLGTSNSAIVGNQDAALRLFKTADQADVLPSVIYIDKRGNKFVGRRAYDQAVLAPENVAQGFKRIMGTSTPIAFAAAGITMTPEEASAEIIRTLLTQAYTDAGKIQIDGTIVTIPAAFNQMQSEATIRAANMADLDCVGLLQEPIAAAMASMANTKTKNGQFLVYDLGGGTLDLALVQSVNGTVNVIAHEGINALGGRDFDLAIVNAVVRPWLYGNFALPENLLSTPRYKRLLGMARWRAEQAKIELSTKDATTIFLSDEEARVDDESGNALYIEVPLTRKDLEAAIQSRLDESAQLCRKILKDSGYSHSDMDRVVLIGGPTKMPWIRDHIPRDLGIPVDLQTDPMTAVAFGAAIFAESRDWSQGATSRKPTRARQTSTGPVEIRYDYPARNPEDRARVKISPTGGPIGQGYQIQIESTEGWSSGRKALVADMTIEVPLPARGDNHFRVLVFDPQGAPETQATTRFTITRTYASAAGIPATQTIAAAVLDDGVRKRNALHPIIKKGTLLPASGREPFRAAHDLKAGSDDHIDLDLYQMADGVPEPDKSLHVGGFRIDGRKLTPGMTVRKFDDIIVHWTMDDNGLLKASIEIPSVRQTFDTGNFYTPSAGHQNFEGADGSNLACAALDRAEAELSETQEALGARSAAPLQDMHRKLGLQRETLVQADDAATRRSVAESALRIRQDIARLRDAPENRAAMLKQQIETLVQDYDRFNREEARVDVTAQFDTLAATARQGVAAGTPSGLRDAELALQQMQTLHGQILWQQPSFIIYVFRSLAQERYLAIDKALHDRLVVKGEACVSRNDIPQLLDTIREIYANRFEVGGSDRAVTRMASLLSA